MPRKKSGGKRRRRMRRAAGSAVRLGAPANAIAPLRNYLSSLEAERSRIDQQIATLRNALGALGSSVPAGRSAGGGGGGKRRESGGVRTGTLKDYILRVLRGKRQPMRVVDISSAVLKAGFKTKNKTLAKSVGLALTEMPETTKLGRGLFGLKSA